MIYNYGFTIDKVGINEEWLNIEESPGKLNKVFYRHRSEDILEFYSLIPKRQQENMEVSLGTDALIVSLGSMLQVETLDIVWREKIQKLST